MNNVLTATSVICKEMVYIYRTYRCGKYTVILPKFSFFLFAVFDDLIQLINQHVIR